MQRRDRVRNLGRDARRVHELEEIPIAFQKGRRRFEAERPATVDAQRRRDHFGIGFAADTASYFPRIREGQPFRDVREQKAKNLSAAPNGGISHSSGSSRARTPPPHRQRRQSASGSSNDSRANEKPEEMKNPTSIVMNLDKGGMEAMHFAFGKHGTLSEEAFVTEMLSQLESQKQLDHNQRVDIVRDLSTLFRHADLRSCGRITWLDFSTFLSRNLDVRIAVDAEVIKKVPPYQSYLAPEPMKMTSEVLGMFYFADVNEVLLHDTRNKGFQMLDASTNTIVRRAQISSVDQRSSHILDALYSPFGRYVITASTSPVISLYDVDRLQIRQQIPTNAVQTALAISSRVPTSPILFSSCTSGQVHMWDIDSLACLHSFFHEGHTVMSDIEVIDSMAMLAGACLDSKIYLVDLNVNRVTKTLVGHRKGVSLLKYNAEQGYLISGGLDHMLQIWNPRVEQHIGSLKGHHEELIGLEVSTNSSQVITADKSGMIKIWDLRKFAEVQTITAEFYIKGNIPPRKRPMNSMCYIADEKRIAIAHSSIFFLDPSPTLPGTGDILQVESTSVVSSEIPAENETLDSQEGVTPIAMMYSVTNDAFIAFTGYEIKFWEVHSGRLVRSVASRVGSEMTSVCAVDNHFSCFVGTIDGLIARLILPSGAVVIRKSVHHVEVTAIKWISATRQVVSGAVDGNVFILHADTLEVIHSLNHWRGVQSSCTAYLHEAATLRGSETYEETTYSIPSTLRACFFGNETDRLKRIFCEADRTGSGSIPLSKVPHILQKVFPGAVSSTSFRLRPHIRRHGSTVAEPAVQAVGSDQMLTFATLLEVLKDFIAGDTIQGSMATVSCLDVHDTLLTLVTGSSTDRSLCIWNAKSGRVMAQESSASDHQAGHATLQILYLQPYPCFICLEENSSQLSLWTSAPMPPMFMHSHELLMRMSHHMDQKNAQSKAFVTHLPSANDRENSAKTMAPAIRCVDWLFGGTENDKLLCVGDEQGFISVYSFSAVFDHLEALQQRTQHTNNNFKGVLSSSLVAKVHQWKAHKPMAIRSIKMTSLGGASTSSCSTIAMTLVENGAISIWSLKGELLGRLNEPDPFQPVQGSCATRAVPWKLRVESELQKHDQQHQASDLLKRVDERLTKSSKNEESRSARPVVRSNRRASITRKDLIVSRHQWLLTRTLPISSSEVDRDGADSGKQNPIDN